MADRFHVESLLGGLYKPGWLILLIWLSVPAAAESSLNMLK